MTEWFFNPTCTRNEQARAIYCKQNQPIKSIKLGEISRKSSPLINGVWKGISRDGQFTSTFSNELVPCRVLSCLAPILRCQPSSSSCYLLCAICYLPSCIPVFSRVFPCIPSPTITIATPSGTSPTSAFTMPRNSSHPIHPSTGDARRRVNKDECSS